MLSQLQTFLDGCYERDGKLPAAVKMNVFTRRELIKHANPETRVFKLSVPPEQQLPPSGSMTFNGISVEVDNNLRDYEVVAKGAS